MGVEEAIAILENGAEVAKNNASVVTGEISTLLGEDFDNPAWRDLDFERQRYRDAASAYSKAIAYLLVHQNKETENVQDHA